MAAPGRSQIRNCGDSKGDAKTRTPTEAIHAAPSAPFWPPRHAATQATAVSTSAGPIVNERGGAPRRYAPPLSLTPPACAACRTDPTRLSISQPCAPRYVATYGIAAKPPTTSDAATAIVPARNVERKTRRCSLESLASAANAGMSTAGHTLTAAPTTRQAALPPAPRRRCRHIMDATAIAAESASRRAYMSGARNSEAIRDYETAARPQPRHSNDAIRSSSTNCGQTTRRPDASGIWRADAMVGSRVESPIASPTQVRTLRA
jgi:hypothetical protein